MRGGADVRTVGVVGAGAIGASWTALALAHGLAVVVGDPDPAARDRLATTLERLLPDLGADPRLADGFDFATDPSAAARADLVLEAGPERLEVKRELFAALDAAAAPDVVLASSSSGLAPSSVQDACAHPERVLVAHPFNPPHLVPLVEVVGGTATSEKAVEAVTATLARLGRRPVRIRRELPGHVANRLQAALWREAYHLVGIGAIGVGDLDTVVASGPGLRWALLGPLATQGLSGGPGGMRHVLEHLGPPMVEWWADLGDPELTPDLVDTLVDGVAAELAGDDADTLARRDAALIRLIELKREAGL